MPCTKEAVGMAIRKFTRWVRDVLSGLGMFTAKDTMVLGPAAEYPVTPSQKNNGALSSYTLISYKNEGMPICDGPIYANDFPAQPFVGASNPAMRSPAIGIDG